MSPALKDGGYVFLNPRAELRIGDIVLARHPFKQSVTIIKRIREIRLKENVFSSATTPQEVPTAAVSARFQQNILSAKP